MACIAEARDPDGKKTGRRMIPFEKIQTSSYAKLAKIVGKEESQDEDDYKSQKKNEEA